MATLDRQALDDLNAAIELEPQDIAALGDRGLLWETLGDLDRAAADYSRIMELNPTHPEAYIRRGNVYWKRADYSNAVIDETVAIQLAAELCDPIAYFYRAQAYRGLQRWQEALDDYQTYIDTAPQGRHAPVAAACVAALAVLLEPAPARPAEAPIGGQPPADPNPGLLLDQSPPTEAITAQPGAALQLTATDLSPSMAINTPNPTDVPRPDATKAPKFSARIGRLLRTPSVDRVISHLRIPLFANGYALVLSSAAMSGLGLLYWAVAAHLYGKVSVGLNTAAISAMMFLGAVAQLNLAGILTRFVPVAGRSTARWIAGSYLIGAVAAGVMSTVFFMGLRIFSPELNSFLTGPGLVLWFVLATICWTVINIQDGVLTGLRQAIWVPVKNTGFGLAKILLLVFFASTMPITGVFASWTIGVVLVILPTSLFIFLRLLPKRAHSGDLPAVGLPQVARYAIGDYFGALCVLGSTTLLPLLVIRVAGAAQNAYFYMSSTIGFTLYMIGPSMGLSLTVEAVHDQAKLSIYSWKVFLQTLRIVVPLAGIFIIGAPLMLRIFGYAYAIEGSLLLRLLALSAIPNVVNALYIGVARAQGRAGRVFVVSALLSCSVLVLSYIFLVRYGISGIGLAWTIGQGICAVILLTTQFRPLWTARVHAAQETPTGGSRRRPITSSAAMAENEKMAEHPVFGRQNSPSRILQIAGVTARKIRDTAISRWSPSYIYHQRQLATTILPEVLPTLSAPADLPPPATWTVRHVTRTVTDRGVVMLGPAGQPSVAVLKMANSPQAVLSLQRNNATLKLLCSDERLGSWRTLIPTLLAEGAINGQHYAIEQALPGRNAQGLLKRRVVGPRLQLSAAKTISRFHEATATIITVGEEVFERWVGVPLQVLRYWNESLPSAMSNRPAIETLASQLRRSLFGLSLSVSRIHGDFWGANLLATPDGSTITGILDWDLAAADDLPQLDQIQLLIATRKLLRGRQIGSIMVELFKDGSWLPYEQAILDDAQLPGDTVDIRTLLLLTWLRDVASNLTESARYPDKWYWQPMNIKPVLQNL